MARGYKGPGMGRPAGSVGVVKRSFETDFIKEARKAKLSMGEYAVWLLTSCREANDRKTAISAFAVVGKWLPSEVVDHQRDLFEFGELVKDPAEPRVSGVH